MKKLLLFFILSFLFCPVVYSATYYMSTTGNNSNPGTEASPKLTLYGAFSAMSSGDTLIIEDGTYTGYENRITVGGETTILPPVGTASAYTKIKARNDGAVVFDGEGTRNMFDVQYFDGNTNQYWQFEGLIWCNTLASNVTLTYSSYVKFLRCGAYDAGAGNNVNFSFSRGCSYILAENCYAYGEGRYKFIGYQSSNIIFRQCVGRLDHENAGGEVLAIFSMYSVTNGKVQNCIAIDSDQTAYWSNYADLAGGFAVPSTDADADNVEFNQCVSLNNALGGLTTTGTEYTRSADVTYNNCVFWDYVSANPGASVNNMRGLRDTINHCTFGITNQSNSDIYEFNSYDRIPGGGDNNSTIKNSIIYSHTGGTLFYDIENYSYLCLYGNDNNPSPIGTGSVTTNPLTNSLLYITRIESGSDLDGAGESGSDIGANIKTLIGTSGTLYGETGYATDTGVSMWPFPNEDLIRTKMKAYSGGGVSGDRGFCADGETLTHYIMNYLGNGNPYGDGGTATTKSSTTGNVLLSGGVVLN